MITPRAGPDMANHDKYGKELMHQLLGGRWSSYDSRRSIDEAGVRADLDGVIIALDSQQVECAVEIEARVYKQIRGAIVDLALHSAAKKLLVVIKAQRLGDTPKITKHCNYVWQQVAEKGHGRFAMVVLEGTGDRPSSEVDLVLLKNALQNLGILKPDSSSVDFAP